MFGSALRAKQFTATGSLGSGHRTQTYVFTPAAANSTCTIKEGGASGTTRLTLSAPGNGASIILPPIVIEAPYLSALTTDAKLSVLE